MAPNPRDESYLLVFTRGSARRAPFAEGPTELLVTLERDGGLSLGGSTEGGDLVARFVWRDGRPFIHPIAALTINDEALTEVRALSSEDVIVLGSSALVVHCPAAPRGRALLSPQALIARLAEEAERAVRYRRSLSLLVVRLAPATGAALDEVATQVASAVRQVDVVGFLGPAEIGVLFPETGEDASLPAARILAALRERWPDARGGLACLPFDGADDKSLLAGARAGALVAAAGGVGRVSDAEIVDLAGAPFVAVDPKMRRLLSLARELAPSELPVLVVGETGTGKELFAAAIHALSARRAGPFVSVNCAALSDSLLEAELFGHERGAFTGAVEARAGLIEGAHLGTLFLDEIGDAPPRLQAELLRVLETGKLRRVGAGKERSVDVRIVAATNRVLDEDVKTGRFRRDLLYRLNAATLAVPPLRERPLDVPPLARMFLLRACTRQGRDTPSFSAEVMERLLAHVWPGNVRELRNVIEYVAAVARGPVVQGADLPADFDARAAGGPRRREAAPARAQAPAFASLADEIADLERRRIAEALHTTHGVRVRAAALLGMPLRTFATKLKLYRLDGSEASAGGDPPDRPST